MDSKFVPELWSKRMLEAFAKATSPAYSYMYGDLDPTNALRDLMESGDREGIREWYCRYGTWTKVFAWKPVDTEIGKVWLRFVMRAHYHGRGYTDRIHLTIPAFVGYRLDGKVGQ